MRITSGKVVAGQIIPDDPLPEGTVVEIIVRDGEESFVADAELEAELLEAIAEADRGELIPAEEVLRRLRER